MVAILVGLNSPQKIDLFFMQVIPFVSGIIMVAGHLLR